MRLTLHTDYALRALIYLALAGDKGGTIAEIAKRYRISRNHLMKVVRELGALGLIAATRGRSGGLRLAKPAAEIRIGDVVRKMEGNLVLVECFDPVANTCPIAGVCGLKGYLNEALKAYLATLDRYTLADALGQERKLRKVLGVA